MVWVPGSEKTYSGSRLQGSKGTGSWKLKIEKIGPIYKEIQNFLEKLVIKLLWFGIRDRKKPIPDPGFRGQKAPDPGSGSVPLTVDIVK
jgi:hypothetical protein